MDFYDPDKAWWQDLSLEIYMNHGHRVLRVFLKALTELKGWLKIALI